MIMTTKMEKSPMVMIQMMIILQKTLMMMETFNMIKTWKQVFFVSTDITT